MIFLIFCIVEQFSFPNPDLAFFFANFQDSQWQLSWTISNQKSGEWNTRRTITPVTFNGEHMLYPVSSCHSDVSPI